MAMSVRRIPLLVVLGFAVAAWSAEPATVAPVEPPIVAAPAAAADAKLRAELPDDAAVVERDGAWWWDDGAGGSFRLTGVTAEGDPQIATEQGDLTVGLALVRAGQVGLVARLPALLSVTKAAGLTLSGLRFNVGIMTGPHLRSSEALVLAEGVLRRVEPPASDAETRLSVLRDAIAATHRAVSVEQDLGELARRSIDDVLDRLAGRDAVTRNDFDMVDPSFARRVVRCGWLRDLLPSARDTVAALEKAVSAAESFGVLERFAQDDGARLRLERLEDAFGRAGWILVTPTRSACVQAHHALQCHYGTPDLQLVTEMSAGADPVTAAAAATAATLYWGSRPLARWTRQGGFAAEEAVWRQAITTRGQGAEAVSGFIPPHLVITDLDGDVVNLITAHGALRPPRDGGAEEARRFLADAAQALPDAAHLDLIGEHLFQYVYDSPDTSVPQLIGSKATYGDIHQTSVQTLAATTGGMFRGDCDDLAELYHDLAVLQGRLPHVIDVPRHAACAWAERRDDGRWHTFVLHTGTPIEVAAPTLPESLHQAYRALDPDGLFDPNQVGLALRFAGENTRSNWILSWRIFAEPEYSRVMIDVERDWYFHTHQRGIAKMLKLIADGDQDTANYEELSGLYRRVGQWDKSIAYKREAMKRRQNGEVLAHHAIELISLLVRGERFDEAATEARALIDRQLPALAKEEGFAPVRIALMLATVLDRDHHLAERQQVLERFALPRLAQQAPGVRHWLETKFDQRAWNSDRFARDFRSLSGALASHNLGLLRQRGPAVLRDDQGLRELTGFAQDYLDHFAFVPDDVVDGELRAYATTGFLYETVLGHDRFRALLDQSPLPEAPPTGRLERLGGWAPLGTDLPWIKCSVAYWTSAITLDLWSQKPETFAAGLVTRHLAPLEAAYQRCRELKLVSSEVESSVREARLIGVLLDRDAARLGEVLRELRTRNDRRSYEKASDTIGTIAKYLPADWFAQVLAAWRTEVDVKPFYFNIAWTAAVAKADAAALAAGELAAARFADDPDFQEELVLLKQVLAEHQAKPPVMPAGQPPAAVPAAP
jgi:hypothetical protein